MYSERLTYVKVSQLSLWWLTNKKKIPSLYPLEHPYDASIMAQAFLENISRLCYASHQMKLDEDPIFLTTIYKNIFQAHKPFLAHSIAYRPQSKGSNGAMEVLNWFL